MKRDMASLCDVWTRLNQIQTVQFSSTSRTGIGWSGSGSGLVQVSNTEPNVLVFTESGTWRQYETTKIRFSNVFRWSRGATTLKLEHLRFGVEKPVFLFDMQADENGVWREIIPHPCSHDCYRASLKLEPARILVQWSVRGPNRDEIMDYVYV